MVSAVSKTYMAKPQEVQRQWHLVDASDKVLGRLATAVATVLMGKDKPSYTPHVDVGDFVVVVNAAKIRVTGRKRQQKQYDYYTYYPGGRKVVDFATLMDKRPEKVVELAIQRMLPKNALGRQMFKKLKVYRGPEHPHAAQQPGHRHNGRDYHQPDAPGGRVSGGDHPQAARAARRVSVGYRSAQERGGACANPPGPRRIPD